MLLLVAIARFMPTRELNTEQGLPPANPAIGHIGLTIIALVYVLITVWQG